MAGAKSQRSETVSIRLDPRLRYLAEIAARVQRRSLSSFIEWAVQESLSDVQIKAGDNPYGDNNEPGYEGAAKQLATVSPSKDYSIAARSADLWDVDSADRFVKLAQLFPHLLTFAEQRLWKDINEDVGLRKKTGEMDMKKLRLNWDETYGDAMGGQYK